MNISLTTLLLVGFSGLAAADVPRKAPISRYTSLYTNSPFTSKPAVEGTVEESNVFEDYALIGISPIGGGGHRVTLINKKDPEERLIVDSDNPKAEFQIVGVTRKPGDPLGTVVTLSSGSKQGTVEFDEKLLTLVQPQPAAPPQPVPGQPAVAGQAPVQPDGQAAPQRQPRPRVIPPPAGAGAPAPAPGAAAATDVQQSGQRGQRGNRPSRRGN